jgi:hypothetical protein
MKKIKKGLAGIVLAGASLFGGVSQAEARDPKIWQVPVQWAGVNFQTSYLDRAIDGDVFELYQPDNEYSTTAFQGNYHTDKKININGNYLGFIDCNFTIFGNGSLNLQNSLILNGNGDAVSTIDGASFYATTSQFASVNNTINFNSTGNLTVSLCTFPEPQSTPTTSINLEKIVGNIDINQNLIQYSRTGIRTKTSSDLANVYILNNTFLGNDISLKLENLLNADGILANNSFSDSGTGIYNYKNKGKIDITKNNLFGNTADYFDDPPYSDYYFNPNFIDDNGSIDYTSPLVGRGMYIDGVTTWFSDAQHTYIGYSAPSPIPEPSSIIILSLGSLGLLLKRGKKE